MLPLIDVPVAHRWRTDTHDHGVPFRTGGDERAVGALRFGEEELVGLDDVLGLWRLDVERPRE